jgi:hypothetical protein
MPMRIHPLALSLGLAATAVSGAAGAAEHSLTVYSGDFDAVANGEAGPGGPGFALVERRVGFDLSSGDTRVAVADLPRALDSSSVNLRPLGDARVRSQRFDFATADQAELLRRALGRTVSVEQGVGNERRSYTGVLLAAGNGLTLREPDGRIRVLADYASFSLDALPDGVVNSPTLQFTLGSARGGRQDFRLGYATAGLGWRAEYTATVSGQGRDCRMDFEGAAMVANRSGSDFEDVALTLVAGEPNRVHSPGPRPAMAMARAEAMVADGAPAPQASGEYQSYRLPGTGDLPQGSVQRLPLVDPARGVACERHYRTGAEGGVWVPPYPMVDRNAFAVQGEAMPVRATLQFANTRDSGLGLPLPAGRVRMFDGSDFLGEAQLGHTAAGRDVELAIGNVFDLSAERSREDFQLDGSGRTITESFRVVIRNARPQAVAVQLDERLPRWTQWEIVAASQRHQKTDAQSIRFDVAVPAQGEAVLTYTVRYRWAEDVRIPQ